MIDPARALTPPLEEAWDTRFRRDIDIHLALRQVRVLCVGLGFIGSQVALLLAQMGVGHLTLVDPDTLEGENLSRHAADAKYVGLNKAVATGRTIVHRLPDVVGEITSVTADLATSEDKIRLLLTGQDIVILATGNAAVDRAYNRIARDLSVPTLVPGLLPGRGPLLGDLLTTSAGPGACIECLRPEDPGEPPGAEAQPGLLAEGMILASHTALAAVDLLAPASRGSSRLTDQLRRGRNYLLLARTPAAALTIRTAHHDDCPACGQTNRATPITAPFGRPVPAAIWLPISVASGVFGAVSTLIPATSDALEVVVYLAVIASVAALLWRFLPGRR